MRNGVHTVSLEMVNGELVGYNRWEFTVDIPIYRPQK